jgi:hypothetical protein
MASYLITPMQLETSLQQYFGDNFSLLADANVQWPRTSLDISGLDEWVELYLIDGWHQPRQRAGTFEKHQASWLTVVQCYVTPTNVANRGIVIASSVATVFNQAVIPIYDYSDSSEPLIGTARYQEAEIRDLTESMRNQYQNDMQHVIVRVDGRMYES